MLDTAIAVLKERPRAVLAITATFIVPVQVLAAYLQRDAIADFAQFNVLSDPSLASDSQGTSLGASLVALYGPTLALPFVAGALARLVTAWYAGGDVTTGEALRSSARRWWAIVVVWFITHVAETVAAVFAFVPIFLLWALWQATVPIIVVEGLGPFAALKRAGRLAGRRYGQMLVAVLAAFWVAYALDASLPVLPQIIGFALGDDFGWLFFAIGNSIAGLVTAAFLAGFAVFVYLDLRVRVEGLDLQLAADRHFARAA
jgi:hypothetical protein